MFLLSGLPRYSCWSFHGRNNTSSICSYCRFSLHCNRDKLLGMNIFLNIFCTCIKHSLRLTTYAFKKNVADMYVISTVIGRKIESSETMFAAIAWP